VATIINNSVKFIPRWLESVKQFATSYIVLDASDKNKESDDGASMINTFMQIHRIPGAIIPVSGHLDDAKPSLSWHDLPGLSSSFVSVMLLNELKKNIATCDADYCVFIAIHEILEIGSPEVKQKLLPLRYNPHSDLCAHSVYELKQDLDSYANNMSEHWVECYAAYPYYRKCIWRNDKTLQREKRLMRNKTLIRLRLKSQIP
jgi:hypothetical protein